MINGSSLKDCERFLRSDCPEETARAVGNVGMAGPAQLEDAIEVLRAGFPKWRDTDPELRSELLFRVADRLERERADLAALEIMECGKPWVEADADVAEAIDFLRYYGRQARQLFATENRCPWDGEDDFYFHEPRGICGVIGPWNFPLAIPCGMFSAALVTGNAVLFKPAEQSPVIASRLFGIFLEEGMPPDAAAFLPGEGETLGAAIVEHPAVETIAFTGSKAVGMGIIREAGRLREGQVEVKRVIAEMGGKNAIVVDEGADLDQAVKGILYSAFGYAGQKCSACSRLYVHEAIHERLLERLVPAVRSTVCGRASDPAVDLGPVIDEAAVKRIRSAVESAGGEPVTGRLEPELPEGRYIPATLFPDLPPDHELLREELFGPVLGMVRVASFEEGIELANRHEYGLTGAVFSRHPEHLKMAARRFRVGNLYLNRGCTGSLVGRQPFGGFKHSGVGSKAGGPDYLKQFVLPRVVCENTLRQGFAPMEGD